MYARQNYRRIQTDILPLIFYNIEHCIIWKHVLAQVIGDLHIIYQ